MVIDRGEGPGENKRALSRTNGPSPFLVDVDVQAVEESVNCLRCVPAPIGQEMGGGERDDAAYPQRVLSG